MELPSSEELSRWTVSHINTWLAKCSLSVFRDDFLRDGIDGSKLLRLKAQEVNQRYKNIPTKKRNLLIDYLSRIESSRQPATWSPAPYLPPRPGANNRKTLPPPPVQYQDSPNGADGADGADDEGEWSDFDEDDDGDDYLEPATAPPEIQPPPSPGYNANRNMPEPPEQYYEIPEEDLDEIRQQPQSFERKPTIVEGLRDALSKRPNRDTAADSPTPPPRPPRKSPVGGSPFLDRRTEAPTPTTRQPPPPPPTTRYYTPPPEQPPEDNYEVMNDVITETQRVQQLPPAVHVRDGADTDVPPEPDRRERTPQPVPAERKGKRTRQPYQEVKKPGLQAPRDQLSVYDWYHGKISRDHAQKIFQREQQDGMFLIRKSETNPKQPYTLVLWHCNRIWNIPIRMKDNGNYAAGKFKEGETEFTSVLEIVEHFKEVSLNLKSDNAAQGNHKLTIPAPKH
ncbi:uncharacterized protein LOC143276229 isoform X2 [Babylonia areolata]|uniref:uncharacterized protein LOC143276229 isoform X2 n=1 Tax=Babylonia areolata TaxID=304850 RepID=UPI003FD2CDF7